MAFNSNFLSLLSTDDNIPTTPRLWGYGFIEDSIADVSAVNYFKPFADFPYGINQINFQVGDNIYCNCSDGNVQLVILTISPTVTTTPVVLGANRALSNLAAVAINASLIPGVNGVSDLGSPALRWNSSYINGIKTGTTIGNTTVISARDVDGAADTAFITLTAANTPTCKFSGDITGVTQAASDNSTKLATTAYVDAQAPISGANKALSNLDTVAINTSLISDTDVTDNLGSAAIRWNNVYAAGVVAGDTAADTLVIAARDVDGAVDTPFITLTSNDTPTCALSGDVTGVTQAASDNSTKIATTAYADAAAAAAGGGAPFPFNGYSQWWATPFMSTGNTGTSTLSAGTASTVLLYLPQGFYNALKIDVVVADTTASVEFGLYAAAAPAGNVDPNTASNVGARVINCGSIADVSTTGEKTLTFASTEIDAGYYYLAMLASTVDTALVVKACDGTAVNVGVMSISATVNYMAPLFEALVSLPGSFATNYVAVSKTLVEQPWAAMQAT